MLIKGMFALLFGSFGVLILSGLIYATLAIWKAIYEEFREFKESQ